MSNFVHLRVRSEYSVVDSIVRIQPLMESIKQSGMKAVGIAEYCNFFSAIKSYQAAIKQGIKPLLGVDLPCCHRDKPKDVTVLSLICQNLTGYRHATELVSKAYLEGQVNGQPRVFYEWLTGFEEGLICLSGASQGLIAQRIRQGDMPGAEMAAHTFSKLFQGRFYLEIQRIGRDHEHEDNQALVTLADKLQLPLVATQDVRFLKPNEHDAHEVRVCIHEGRTLSDNPSERRYTPAQYLKSAEDMLALFSDLPQAVQNTVEISKRCTVQLRLGQACLPTFEVPAGITEADYLVNLAKRGLEARLAQLFSEAELVDKRAIYDARLQLELDVIRGMEFPGYFLIVADFIGWAKQEGIPVGPGRGSGAGSLVAYVLNITDLDPLAYELLFERFLNPERVSMPDFDVDFCMEGRDRVIAYVAEKYGRANVSQIITFGTMAAKAVIRDVGRVLGQPYGFVDKLAKLVPFELGMTLDKALLDSPELKARYDEGEDVKDLMDLALQLEGLTRNPGKHAGGVVIAPSPLTDFTAVYCEAGSNQVLSQFDKDDVEAVGLVKFDFLGLRTLTIIDWALKTINQQRMQEGLAAVEINAIPLDCQKTFDLLKSCQTSAVFQLESRGMKDLIFQLQPDSFEEIIALVALFRPGPLQSGMVDDFISRKHGRDAVVYLHPDLESILKATYGVILYQEQVMQIAQTLANYTLGSADLLRRAMGKKKPEEMLQQRAIFVSGASQRGIGEEISVQLFDLMEKFAGYGFNKSHSAAYALVSYQTAWLKAHYPAAFMAAVLSSDLDNTDKVALMVDECRQMGLTLLPPSVESSAFVFTVVQNTIRYGLGAIKGVGEAAVSLIRDVRPPQGFCDLFSFCECVDLRKVNRRVIEALIKSGAMDDWGQERGSLMSLLEEAIHAALQYQDAQAQGQLDLFGASDDKKHAHATQAKVRWSLKEKLGFEKEALGLYLSSHPATAYQAEFSQHCVAFKDLHPSRGKKGRICALIIGIRTLVTKKGKTFMIMGLEDAQGRFEVLFSVENYQRSEAAMIVGEVVVIEGDVMKDDFTGKAKLIGSRCYTLEQTRSLFAKCLALTLSQPTPTMVSDLQSVLKSSPGFSKVEMAYQTPETNAKLQLGEAWRVKASDALIHQLQVLLGEENVAMCYT